MRARIAVLVVALLSVPVPAPAAESARRIQIVAEPGTVLQVEGRYAPRRDLCPARQPRPLRSKYRGTLTITRERDGRIRIVNALSFPEYLKGLAEVPRSWPEEALRAQVIAARTYALEQFRRGRAAAARRGWDICATDQCQVYRGAVIELGAFGERWVRAVDRTRGRVITHDGRPIQAYYFSTSTGRTRDSFPGGTPLPYLRVTTGEDGDSPLARWRVVVPLADLAVILRAHGVWPGGRIETVRQSGSTVRIAGGTRSIRLSRADLRIAMNSRAVCEFPGRYPTNGSAKGTRLPLTVPSATYRLDQDGRRIVLRGRGWGHGVGMSQYGARSLADRGRDAGQILSHFYRGIEISRVDEPGAIRVLAAEDLASVRIAADGPFRVTVDGEVARMERFAVASGERLRVTEGVGPSLPPTLTIEAERGRARTGDAEASIPFRVSTAARVSVTMARDGRTVARAPETSFEPGEQEATVTLPTALTPGRYDVTLRAYDGYDRVRDTTTLAIARAASPTPTPTVPQSTIAAPAPRGGTDVRLIVFAIVALAFGLGGLWLARARWITRR